VSYPKDQRIQRPEEAGPSWYLIALSQVRREGLGHLPIRFELNGSEDVVGRLDQPNTVVGPLGTVVLSDGRQIACGDIVAFTVLSEPKPADDG
jgi:hypothetical protein